MTVSSMVTRRLELKLRISSDELNIPDVRANTNTEMYFRPNYVSILLYRGVTGEFSLAPGGVYVSGPSRKRDGHLGYNDHQTSYPGIRTLIPNWIIELITSDRTIDADVRLFFAIFNKS